MKRPKSLPSRRQRPSAGGWCWRSFCWPSWPSTGPASPQGKSSGLGKPAGVGADGGTGPGGGLSHRVTFSANQDALLLTVYQPLHPLSYSMGWNNAPAPWGAQRPHGSGPCHPLRAPLLGQ